ncbi:glycosyltransferase family 2 protein [Candidatus Sumerlaeota bacterium]|nr:glycosyltransferase family 2 protein [Candidatus Sumerlaeota bacterium]
MYAEHKIGVVIPCYSAAGTIRDVIAGLPDYVDVIVAVDDASPDGTLDVLQSIDDSRLIVERLKRNQGVGGAMAAGFRRILQEDADIIVKIDSDGQMDPAMMLDLIEPVAADACEYAKGNRFRHFTELQRMPSARKLGNIVLTFWTKLASGYWHVFDPQNGYVAIRSDVLRRLNLERLAQRRYFFENEMLIQLYYESARVLDCPMPAIYEGQLSSLHIHQVVRYFPPLLIKGFFARMFYCHVLKDFSAIIPLFLLGALLFCWGFCFGAWTWIRSWRTGVVSTTGTVMLSVLPLILGVQMLLQALLLDVMNAPRVEWRKQRRR